jgi:hypothetical protein
VQICAPTLDDFFAGPSQVCEVGKNPSMTELTVFVCLKKSMKLPMGLLIYFEALALVFAFSSTVR